VESLRTLDLWLEHIDTREVVPLFDPKPQEYTVPSLRDTLWHELPAYFAQIIRDNDLTALDDLQPEAIEQLLEWLASHEAATKAYQIVLHLLSASISDNGEQALISMLLHILPSLPNVAFQFFRAEKWLRHKPNLADTCEAIAPLLLRKLILSCPRLQDTMVGSFKVALCQVQQLGFQEFAELVELIALTARSPDFAINLLLECLQPEITRFLIGRSGEIERFANSLFALALEHVEEASESPGQVDMLVTLTPKGASDGFTTVDIPLRLDAPKSLTVKAGDHIRLCTASAPKNSPLEPVTEIDGIVQRADMRLINVKCFQKLPSYYQECSWRIRHCGSFVSIKSMFDALVLLYTQKEECCRPYETIVGLDSRPLASGAGHTNDRAI
jgi:regulator of nonsense transcripts 1